MVNLFFFQKEVLRSESVNRILLLKIYLFIITFFPGVIVMLTCPQCHHLLGPLPSCTHTPSQQPLLCTLAPPGCNLPHSTPLPSPASTALHLTPESDGGGGGGGERCTSSWGRTGIEGETVAGVIHHLHHHQQQHGHLQEDFITSPTSGGTVRHASHHPQQQPLQTPHISGSMFHFPVVQLQPHITCQPSHPAHTACQFACQVQCVTHGVQVNHASLDNRCGGKHIRPQLSIPRSASMGFGFPSGSNVPNNSWPNQRYAREWNHLVKWTGEDDERCLEKNKNALQECGYYWEKLTWQDAISLLQSCAVGTFIIRDSADRHYRYTLSVQTDKGPTSVRIDYNRGKFRLDCENNMKSSLPEFSSVISLIEHYVRVSKSGNRHVWVDAEGKVYSPIIVRLPLWRSTPSLKHLCRLSINLNLPRSYTSDHLPSNLTRYLDQYSFWC